MYRTIIYVAIAFILFVIAGQINSIYGEILIWVAFLTMGFPIFKFLIKYLIDFIRHKTEE